MLKRSILMTVATASLVLTSQSAFAEKRKDFSASPSPDGSHMVYYSYRGNQLPDLFISKSNGSHEHNVTNTEDIWEIEPNWSSDGKQLVFSGGLSMKDMELYVMDIESGERRQITDGPGNAIAAQWHPSKPYVLYKRWQSDEVVSLHIVDTHSGKEYDLGDEPNKYSNASWSPDGHKLAVVINGGKEDDNVLAITDSHFAHMEMISVGHHKVIFPTWTPDGKGLVFASGADNHTNEIFYLNLASKKVSQISETRKDTVHFTEFSKDGEYLYMDRGSWDSNFLIHRAKWTSDPGHHNMLKLEQVSGKEGHYSHTGSH